MSYRSLIVSGRRELRDFFRLPYILYAGDANWVPPLISETKRILDKKRNPYFSNAGLELINCYNDGVISARAAVIINKGYDREFGKRTALFGFFECINDKDAAGSLFNAVTEYCRSKGVKILIGPFNPNHYSEMGLQVSAFNTAPSFFQTYNPSYYFELLKHCGFSEFKRIHTRSKENINEYLQTRYGNQKLNIPEGFSLRFFDKKKREEELESLREIYNDAFAENQFFLPVTKDEYLFSAKYLDMVTDPDMLIFVEYKGKPAGVIQFSYDINPILKKVNGRINPVKYLRFLLNKKKIKTAVIFAIGIKQAYRNGRVIQVLLSGSIELLKRFDTLGTTWMSYNNLPSVRSAERLGLEPDKEFVILKKDI